MKKNSRLLVATLVGAQMAFPVVTRAQEDFPPPPPPDLSGDFSSAPAPRGSGFGHSGAPSSNTAQNAGGLTKQQKDKFNRSGIEDVTPENFPETIESFDFPNVEIADIIKTVSELTGKNFIVDPGVRGKITIIAPSKITVAEAYKAFLSALAINGFTVVPSGSFLKIKNARNAQRDSIETYSGAYYPNDDQMITRIIHLKHISADVVNRELRILPSKDGEMSVYTPTNSIILSDYGSNIDRVMKIINQLDVPGFEEQLDVVPIKYAKAKDMADLIDKIVNKGQKSGSGPTQGGFAAGAPRFSRSSGTSGGTGNSFFIAIPDDRTNSIIIIGNKSGIQRVRKLIAQLDFKIRPEDNGGVYVYYVKFGDAEKIAQVLQGVTKDAAPKPAAGGGPGAFPGFGGAAAASQSEIFGGDVKVTADKNTNSLVVVASKQDYEQVLSLLAKLDIARDQVFVEAVIMEMTMNDSTNYEIGYYKYAENGKGGFNTLTDINGLLSPAGGSGLILPFTSSDTVQVNDPVSKTKIPMPGVLGFVNFLKKNSRINILSTPQIVALDNQEAEIEVGEKVATSVQLTTGTTGQQTASATFEDATIKLNIKPFISPKSESIRMEIKQSVKQPTTPVGPPTLQANTLPLATRSIKTNIVVQNGDTAVLGGLMKDQDTEEVKKVPLLGDLPIIGWLFKSRAVTTQKVNLLVFLSPKIVRSPTDNAQIVSKKLDERIDYIKNQGGKDPFGAKMEEIRARTANAAGVPLSSPLIEDIKAPIEPLTPPKNEKKEPGFQKITNPAVDDALKAPETPKGTEAKKPESSDGLDLPDDGGGEISPDDGGILTE